MREKFIEYFNEHIVKEDRYVNHDYNLKKAKISIGFRESDDLDSEVKRCYRLVIQALTEQRLSIDYLVPEMVRVFKNGKEI